MRAMRVCACAHVHDEHVDDVSRHRYIDFLVVMINVGLASARPNYADNNNEQWSNRSAESEEFSCVSREIVLSDIRSL